MIWIVHLLVLSLFGLGLADDCIIDYRSRENSWEQQLQKDLSCNYDTAKSPDGNNTEVEVEFIMKSFSFDSKEETFKVYSWMFISWKDERLKWNESNYDQITESIVSSGSIWSPGLRLLNEVDWEEFDHYYGLCTIRNMGYVYCFPKVVHETICNTRLVNWPFDIQKCTLKFGAWTRRDKIKFAFRPGNAMTIMGAEYGTGWTIINYQQEEHEDEDTQLRLTFFLERQAAGLTAIVVIPTILLSVLTLSLLLLEVRDNIRLGIATFSLLCHFYYLSTINEYIPKHSMDTPSILLYVRGSVLVTMMVLILTSLLSYLQSKKAVPPMWVVSTNNSVLQSHAKFFIVPRWEVDLSGIVISDDVERNKVEVWNDFANIINSVCCILFVVVYVIFISMHMPRSVTINRISFANQSSSFQDLY